MLEKVIRDMQITVGDCNEKGDGGGYRLCPVGSGKPAEVNTMPFEVAIDNNDVRTRFGKYLGMEEKEDGSFVLRYEVRGILLAEVRVTPVADANVLRQTVTLTNKSEAPCLINSFTSVSLFSLGITGEKKWHDPSKFLFHYPVSGWMVEGNWKQATLREIGVLPGHDYDWARSIATFSSQGSWGTKMYYPLFVLEDKEAGDVYYMELEGAQHWDFRMFQVGGYSAEGVAMSIGAASDANAWHYHLAPGESYTSVPAIYGCCHGGFEEAVREMLVYRRASTAYGYHGRRIPVVFNDYMNCLWGRPSDSRLIPLIDAAGAAGADYFCIDAGWQRNLPENTAGQNGDWLVAEERFGSLGLRGIFDRIRERGMLPGVWFEWESVASTADSYKIAPDCLITRFGRPIRSDDRHHFNYLSPEVRAHMHARIDALYEMGVRYIKNDYNADLGSGTDMYGTALAEGTRRASEAFYSFVEEVHERHPDLVIENCGGGAGREDNGTLRHFHLQSTSDQEHYENYPAIINGSLAFLAPEKTGIWAYPYPYDSIELSAGAPICPPARIEEWKDGEQTVFNLVNGMCGFLYLSGHISHMDEENRALLHEGVATYQKISDKIASSVPVFPLPMISINEDGFAAQGLLSADGEELFLAVWRIRAEEDTVRIPLEKYAPGYRAEMLYPTDPRGATFSYDGSDLTVTLPKKISARYFRLSK